MKRMKRAYIDLPNGQMHYRYCGEGKPLVMLHMAAGSSEEYEKVAELLKDKFTVYAIDLFGYGYSDKQNQHTDGSKFTLPDHAESVIQFMDAMHIDKAVLYGVLVSANICVRIGIRWPERVESLGLVQLVYYDSYDEVVASRSNYPDIVPLDDGSHLLDIWKRSNSQKYPAEYVEWRAKAFVDAGAYAESMHQAMTHDEDYNILLPQLKTPAVVIAFENYVRAPWMKKVADLIPNAVHDVYKNNTLYAEIVDPETVADVIIKHFA
jgi:pimeloyl-ACP methyl ester carboxylesterase